MDEGVVYTRWPRARSIGSMLEDGRPRSLEGSPNGFDLSWGALDAWAKSIATGQPCEIVLTGYAKRPDGFYWYHESLNPEYLREVLGWVPRGGKLVPVCPECDGYPRHSRGCSMAG